MTEIERLEKVLAQLESYGDNQKNFHEVSRLLDIEMQLQRGSGANNEPETYFWNLCSTHNDEKRAYASERTQSSYEEFISDFMSDLIQGISESKR